jgi:hypothetical protein
MTDHDRSTSAPVEELDALRSRVAELERRAEILHATEQALREERDRAQTYLDVAGVMFVALASLVKTGSMCSCRRG